MLKFPKPLRDGYRIILLSLCSFLSLNLSAQILDSSNSVDWSIAGYPGDFPSYATVLDITDYGAVGDSSTSNEQAVIDAMDALNGAPGVLYFPPGKYYFTAPIILRDSIILRGASSDSSQLYFNVGEYLHCIQAIGTLTQDTSHVQGLPLRGANTLDLDDASNLSAGDYIKIIRYDRDLIFSQDWAFETTGQIIQIQSITGNTLDLKSAIRDTYNSNDSARVLRMDMRKDVGIECLGIERLDQTMLSQTNNIIFSHAANSWVKGVESNLCNYAHVDIRNSTNIEVRDSYFHHGFDYGGGGRAYGVMIHITSGECLVENNTFVHLRHSMIVQAGANGNVFGYNYSTDPFWVTLTLPADAAGDMVLHGNYAYANLFEGNIGQNIVVDDSHAFNGPHNTFFRNKAENYGIFMAISTPTNDQNLIGNVLSGASALYLIMGTGHVLHGNNHLGTIQPQGTETLNDVSLYYTSKPAFMQDIPEWPPIGLPLGLNDGNNAAKKRYEEGFPSACQSEPIYTNVIETKPSLNYKLLPNPASDFLYIEGDVNENTNIELFDFTGKSLWKSTSIVSKIEVNHLANGIYFLRINQETHKWIKVSNE